MLTMVLSAPQTRTEANPSMLRNILCAPSIRPEPARCCVRRFLSWVLGPASEYPRVVPLHPRQWFTYLVWPHGRLTTPCPVETSSEHPPHAVSDTLLFRLVDSRFESFRFARLHGRKCPPPKGPPSCQSSLCLGSDWCGRGFAPRTHFSRETSGGSPAGGHISRFSLAVRFLFGLETRWPFSHGGGHSFRLFGCCIDKVADPAPSILQCYADMKSSL